MHVRVIYGSPQWQLPGYGKRTPNLCIKEVTAQFFQGGLGCFCQLVTLFIRSLRVSGWLDSVCVWHSHVTDLLFVTDICSVGRHTIGEPGSWLGQVKSLLLDPLFLCVLINLIVCLNAMYISWISLFGAIYFFVFKHLYNFYVGLWHIWRLSLGVYNSVALWLKFRQNRGNNTKTYSQVNVVGW